MNGAPPMRMSRFELIALLATISMLVAIGIDLFLPAFGDIRLAFGLGADSNQTAWLVSVYFAGMAVAPIFLGQLSDQVGRKPVLAFGLVLYVACAVAAAFAGSFGLLLAVRFLWGVGAGTGRNVALAVVRDRFEGDQMASIMSTAQAVFMIGPILAPPLGQALLGVMPWQGLFGVAAAAGVVVAGWSTRLVESLPEPQRQRFNLASTAVGARALFGNRQSAGWLIALVFHTGAFLTFLGSSEFVIEEIYGRSGQFAVVFSLMSVLTAGAAVANSRLVTTVGTARMARGLAVVVVVLSVVLLIGALADAGFVAMMAILTVLNATLTMLTPNSTTLIMEPMGDRAGIAAGLLGATMIGGGAILSAAAASLLSDSVLPLAMTYVGFTTVALAAIGWASTTERSAKLVRSRSTPGSVAK